MMVMLVRGVFALCIAVVVLFRPGINQDRDTDAVEALSVQLRSVLEAQGMETFPHRGRIAEGVLRFVVWFAPEGCTEQAAAFPLFVSLNVEAMLSINNVTGWDTDIHHIGQSGPHVSRMSLFAAGSWGRMGNVLGFAETRSPMHMVVVAWPESCAAARDVDLQGVWRGGA